MGGLQCAVNDARMLLCLNIIDTCAGIQLVNSFPGGENDWAMLDVGVESGAAERYLAALERMDLEEAVAFCGELLRMTASDGSHSHVVRVRSEVATL